jgi:4-hydroxybenzoyl-CoA reductase subunit beta
MTYAIHPFTLHHPATVAEAMELQRRHPGALYVAGGTDMVVNLRKRIREPEHLIHLKSVGELRGIQVTPKHLIVGAGTTMVELSGHADVQARLPILAEAAALVAGPTIRQMATVGGNLVLDTRCRYYNQSYFWRKANDFCLKKHGTVCHVAPGGSFCWAAFSADTPPVLLALNAELELAGPAGARTVPLRGFYGKDGRWSLGEDADDAQPGGLAPGELIVRVRIPWPAAGWEGVYEKLRVRDSIDYPLVGVALAIRWSIVGRRIEDIALALTAVNPRPELVKGTESLIGQELSLEALETLKGLANKAGKPMRTTVADPAYRRAMIGALVEKAAGRLAPHLQAVLAQRAQWA